MNDDDGVFVVVVEGATQGPLVMEAEGPGTSYEKARERLGKMLDGRTWFRGCVARLEFVYGNEAVLPAMRGVQK